MSSATSTTDCDDFFDPDPELELLAHLSDNDAHDDSAASHALRTAPVFTGDALAALGSLSLPQRALYGRLIAQHGPHSASTETIHSPKIYINTNAPFSALVCGVQVVSFHRPGI